MLLQDGKTVPLTPKVFDTLLLLVENNGRLVSKDELLKGIWPETFVDEMNLTQNISVLRKALGDTPQNSSYIVTVPGRGYRFAAQVRSIYADETGSDATQQPAVANDRGRLLFGIRTRAWWLVAGAVLAVIVLVAAVTTRRFSFLHKSAAPIRSLAVLPLENLSTDPDQEYFADGMTDELITNLAQIHSLRVISRTSVVQFKHTKKTLPEIAAALNVDAIIEGSVSRTGTTVHIRAQLLDARQDRHLWAETYERQMADILELQTQVAKAITEQVKAKLTPEEDARLTKRPPRNPEAYDALLRGRFLMGRRNADPPRLRKALAYFQQAVAIDPNNAEAWAALGDAYGSLGGDYEAEDPALMRPKARAAIARALELDPNLADAYIASGWLKMFDWDEAGAERDFRRAIELNANDSVAHRRYAFYLRACNRFDDALEENRQAIDLAPLDIMPQILLAWIYESQGLADKAIEQSNRVLELDPNYTSAYLHLGNAYAMKGQVPEALAAYEHLKETDKLDYLSSIALMWAASGNRRQAEAAMAELKELARHNYVSPLYFAAYEARFGDRGAALKWLEKAYQERDPGMIGLAADSSFAKLRSDPRFQDLVRRVESR